MYSHQVEIHLRLENVTCCYGPKESDLWMMHIPKYQTRFVSDRLFAHPADRGIDLARDK